MIDFLKISSMAIFDEIEIEFTEGLNCITGETGAGKSLILDALTLLMGARAGRELVRPGSEKAVIEALFTVSGRELVLRRELFPTGNSRCYVDGKLTTSAGLAEVSSGLIHIYGQHEYQDLLNPRQHMRILEEYAGLSRDNVEAAYTDYVQSEEAFQELKLRIASFSREKDYLEHCLKELMAADMEEGLEDRLAQELQTAQKASELKQSALQSQELIYTGTPSMNDLASEVRLHINRIAAHDPSMEKLVRSMDDISAQLEDMHVELRGRIGAYEYDPQRIDELDERLNGLRDLKRKHHTDESGLMMLMAEMQQKLAILDESDNNTSLARKKMDEAFKRYISVTKGFLEKRGRAAKNLSRSITADLDDLGMPGTVFQVSQMASGDIDKIILESRDKALPPNILLKGEFLISTNVGQNILPLAKIASGGELSRIMLAVKVAQKSSTDATLVFDEIDAGISGQTVKGRNTSSTKQKGRSSERVMELARMMGGDSPSLTVIEHARELVRSHEERVSLEH
jgi:DNA repair protein RecN (Recombination protein N)